MQAATKIAVAGATGRVGRHIVDVLAERGYEPVPMSRATGVDVVTGEGLDTALAGAQAIIDAATGPSPEQRAATDFFNAAAANLQAEGAQAGVARIVVVSIIGTDRYAAGYGAAKLAHEQATLAGPVPARVVRAAQFHEFVGQLMDWGRRGDVIQVPAMRTQLVAARAVAEALVDVATTDVDVPEVAGPREERLVEMARLFARHRGETTPVEEVENPDDPDGRLNTDGSLLPGPQARLAGPTFAEWLASA
jgi:uncharacterized protein YbjT (DUF2867 family)